MRWRQWGIGKRSSRRGDPAGTPGARELSDWIEQSSADPFEDDGKNPYLPPGTPAQWRTELGSAPRKRRKRRTTAEDTAGRGAPRPAESAGPAGPAEPATSGKPAKSATSATSAKSARSAKSGSPGTSATSAKPAKPATSGTPARKRGRRRIVWAAIAVVVGAAAWIVIATIPRPPSDLGGPAIPNASTARADVVDLDPIWSAYPPHVMYSAIQGGSYEGLPFVVAPEVLVLRIGEDRFEDEGATGLMALSRDDGNIAWELALAGVVCAAEPLALPGEGGAVEALACAGERAVADAAPEAPAGLRLLFVDVANGAVLLDSPLAAAPASIATALSGVVVRDVAVRGVDADNHAIGLRWFDTAGDQLWEVNAADLHEEVRRDFDYGSRDDPISRTDWARAGGAVLVSLDGSVLALEEHGAQVPVDDDGGVLSCWNAAVTGESLVCSGLRAVQATRDPGTGQWRAGWRADVDIAGTRLTAPALLGTDSDGGVARVLEMSPDTGQTGAEVARLRGSFVQLRGTADVPLLLGREAMVRLTPGGGRGLWRVPIDRSYGVDGLFVAGDRVVVPDYSGDRSQHVVRDAADGRELARLQGGSLWPVAGRQVLAFAYDGVRLLELP